MPKAIISKTIIYQPTNQLRHNSATRVGQINTMAAIERWQSQHDINPLADEQLHNRMLINNDNSTIGAFLKEDAACTFEEFMQAIIDGELDKLPQLNYLDAYLNRQTEYGVTALCTAAKAGDYAIVSWLLQHGADSNVTNASKVTPLHYAAVMNYIDIMELLLQYGANPNAKEEERGLTPLHGIAIGGKPEAAEVLLKHGASLAAISIHGDTLLHLAVLNSNKPMIAFLLQQGACLKQQNDHGQTAINMANVGLKSFIFEEYQRIRRQQYESDLDKQSNLVLPRLAK